MRARFLSVSLFLAAFFLGGPGAARAGAPQMVLGIAADWNANRGRVQFFERQGRRWAAVAPPVAVLYGKNGLAWGLGLQGWREAGRVKVEGDNRSPAGLFRIGTIYTHDPQLPAGAYYPFHQVTGRDAWVDDVRNPFYNRHYVLEDARNPPPWFAKARMKITDPTYQWLVEIRHNSDPPAPGRGSAIFFHKQRGPERRTGGCTVMPAAELVGMIRWLRADGNPHYALLPAGEYLRLWQAWGLPDPAAAGAILPQAPAAPPMR